MTLRTLRRTDATAATIRAALDDAAEFKRALIEGCECRGSGCETCAYRAEVATEYERVAGTVAEAHEPGAEEGS